MLNFDPEDLLWSADMRKMFWIACSLALLASLSGCAALAVGAVAGGVAGYEAAKHGYSVQSPVVKKPAASTAQAQ